MTATSRAATPTAASASTAAAHTVAARNYCLNSQILSKNYELVLSSKSMKNWFENMHYLLRYYYFLTFFLPLNGFIGILNHISFIQDDKNHHSFWTKFGLSGHSGLEEPQLKLLWCCGLFVALPSFFEQPQAPPHSLLHRMPRFFGAAASRTARIVKG